jgi:transposase
VCQLLTDLQTRLQSPRTRFRERTKVEAAVQQTLQGCDAARWVTVTIQDTPQEEFKQATRGRPGKDTQYVKEVRVRYRLTWTLNVDQIKQDELTDGVFPLLTNQHEMPALEVLQAYKRQPLIEKRFSQFKTDFEVAPVYLKEVTRIQGLLCVYFFALMVQTLLERELRQALANSGYEAIPMYPEHRACQAPTTRRVLDIFENIQRHALSGDGTSQTFVTQLTPLQRQIVNWFQLSPKKYGV